ncbi:MAG: M20 family metallopeptidase [Desulfobacterales bacterium]|nr:M20 family metallopeptidase [Desulfobacterales bacterium]
MRLQKSKKEALTGYFTDQRDGLYILLKNLVEIQSGSRNKAGVDAVGHAIAREMESFGFECSRLSQTEVGDHIIARSMPHEPGAPHLLITGHMDTVFPEDTHFRKYVETPEYCKGPGVADMKGGLVVGMFALKALKALDLMPELPITFFFNSDEEIGSPTSREAIAGEAESAVAGFVLEAGGLDGEVVSGRKGNLAVRLNVEGNAGHAAFAGPDKASAVLELAHKTLAIEALNHPERGITANVGTFNGGIGRNVIAQHACADVDFRFLKPEDEAQVKSDLDRIVNENRVPGTCTTIHPLSGRPPMPQTLANHDLYRRTAAVAKELGIAVKEELRQGVSDANIIAGTGLPVVDGLGPCGAKDHSEDEYILKESLWERTLLFAALLSEF